MKNTVPVVKSLCEPFANKYGMVYIDRFYTSVDLLKELEKKMNLYMMGTVMKNRIPGNLRIAKTSQTFKSMNRGGLQETETEIQD